MWQFLFYFSFPCMLIFVHGNAKCVFSLYQHQHECHGYLLSTYYRQGIVLDARDAERFKTSPCLWGTVTLLEVTDYLHKIKNHTKKEHIAQRILSMMCNSKKAIIIYQELEDIIENFYRWRNWDPWEVKGLVQSHIMAGLEFKPRSSDSKFTTPSAMPQGEREILLDWENGEEMLVEWGLESLTQE